MLPGCYPERTVCPEEWFHIVRLLTQSPVGRKILMALTGQLMVLFLVIHALGNSSIYFGWLNAYADRLHALPPLIWIFRTVMAAVFAVHVFFGVVLTLENRGAKPVHYAVNKSLRATFASRNMIWTGLAIGGFLIFHLLHFTLQVINPEVSAVMNRDALGRPDVFGMVLHNFQQSVIVLVYGVAMVALVLHLVHGIGSSFQTLGLNNDRTMPVLDRAGSGAALLIFLGYMAIPLLIFLGMIHG